MANIKKLVEDLISLTNKETLELIAELEKAGFKASEPQQVVTIEPIKEKVEEKTTFDVTMVSFSNDTKQKMETIKVYKNMNTNMSLMDAKAAIEAAPLKLAINVSKGEAESLKQQFEELGAKITVQ